MDSQTVLHPHRANADCAFKFGYLWEIARLLSVRDYWETKQNMISKQNTFGGQQLTNLTLLVLTFLEIEILYYFSLYILQTYIKYVHITECYVLSSGMPKYLWFFKICILGMI